MNNSIKFSIMTPVYKVERYLPECIESVLGQTYGNFEFILVGTIMYFLTRTIT